METAVGGKRSFTLLTSWSAIEREIIHAHVRPFFMAKYGGGCHTVDRLTQRALLKEVCDHMKDPLYMHAAEDGVVCALHYLFKVVRVGVFVCTRDNAIAAFIPFANAAYTNNWSGTLRFEKSFRNKHRKIVRTTTDRVQEYLLEKKKHLYSVRAMELDTTKWSANAFFVNSNKRDDEWGAHSLAEFYDLIEATLQARKVKDCIFFLNKRDFPLLRKDLREPYSFLWDSSRQSPPKVDPERVRFNGSITPIVSPYTNKDYMDLPFPIAEDWLLASQPENYFNADKLHATPWRQKQPTAFFRGSLTGRVGFSTPSIQVTDPTTNIGSTMSINDPQTRRKPVRLGRAWPSTLRMYLYLRTDSSIGTRFASANGISFGCVQRMTPLRSTLSERFQEVTPASSSGTVRPSSVTEFFFPRHLAFSVARIARGFSCAWVHYVPVNGDLSNLEERIRWCIANDNECQKIVANAQAFAKKFFTREMITEYVAYTLNAIANRSC